MDKQFKDKDPLMMELVKEAGLDQVGPDFTNNVMARLQPKGVAQAALYRPLIGKKAWVVIGSIFFNARLALTADTLVDLVTEFA